MHNMMHNMGQPHGTTQVRLGCNPMPLCEMRFQSALKSLQSSGQIPGNDMIKHPVKVLFPPHHITLKRAAGGKPPDHDIGVADSIDLEQGVTVRIEMFRPRSLVQCPSTCPAWSEGPSLPLRMGGERVVEAGENLVCDRCELGGTEALGQLCEGNDVKL